MLINTTIPTAPTGPTRNDYPIIPNNEFLEILPYDNSEIEFETGPPIVSHTNFPELTPVEAKWNWKKILAGALAGFVAGGIAGAVIGGIAGYLADKDEVILPPGEFTTISGWMADRFTPYFNTIIAELNAVLANNFTAASLPKLNELSAKLCLLQNFYGNVNNDSFLSQEGLDFRYSLIEPLCTALQDLIAEYAASINAGPVNTTIGGGAYTISLLPQPQTGSVVCKNYVIGKPVVTTTTGGSGIKTGTPTTTPVTTSPTSQAVQPSTPIYKRPIAWLAVATVAAVALWPKEKKKAKKGKK